MSIALWTVAVAFLASGVLAYRAAWLCHVHPERAGPWLDHRVGIAVFTFVLTVSGPLLLWLGKGAQEGLGQAALRGGLYVLGVMLHLPFLTWHAGSVFAGFLNPEGRAPSEPDEPLARARAAEERGDVPGALERYRAVLRDEPLRLEARLALAELLARTRRIAQAREVLEQGLRLSGGSSADRARLEQALAALDAPSGTPGSAGGLGEFSPGGRAEGRAEP